MTSASKSSLSTFRSDCAQVTICRTAEYMEISLPGNLNTNIFSVQDRSAWEPMPHSYCEGMMGGGHS
jgi:hypothetical protein